MKRTMGFIQFRGENMVSKGCSQAARESKAFEHDVSPRVFELTERLQLYYVDTLVLQHID